MTRPKTIFKPFNNSVKIAQINKVEQALAQEVESESTFFSQDLAQSVLSVNSDIDVSEDLKAEPTKTIAELLSPDEPVASSAEKPKKKSKNKKNSEEVTDEEKAEDQDQSIEI